MKALKWTLGIIAIVGLVSALVVPMASTQPTGWLSYLHSDPQGDVQFRALTQYGVPAMFTHGTAAPTAANSGTAPMDGEVFVDRSDTDPILSVYSQSATAWHGLSAFYDSDQRTTGYVSIPPLFTHTGDVTMSAGANERLIVYRTYLPYPQTVTTAAVLLVDGGAIAAGDIVGIAVYEDANAGARLSTGTGDGTAAGLEAVDITDVTLDPGFYRFAICTSDDTNMNFAGTAMDDEQIDVISAVAGQIAMGSGANPCVTGVPPATTGALTTRDVAIPFIYFY